MNLLCYHRNTAYTSLEHITIQKFLSGLMIIEGDLCKPYNLIFLIYNFKTIFRSLLFVLKSHLSVLTCKFLAYSCSFFLFQAFIEPGRRKT